MEYIECPAKLACRADKLVIFLAGGITECPNWQQEVVEWFVEQGRSVVIVNPRRKEFDVNALHIAEEQIEWEYDAMAASNIIIFWFPKESTCPIALYELGRYNVLSTIMPVKLFIGTHPEYSRRCDVIIQTKLATGETVDDSLEQLLDRLSVYLESKDEEDKTRES